MWARISLYVSLLLFSPLLLTIDAASTTASDSRKVMQLPSGRFGLSVVDSSHKDSGSDKAIDGIRSSRRGGSDTGYISYMPIAPHKDLHLSSAASAIRAVNATAAQALFSGQSTFTQTLGTYLTYQGGSMFCEPNTMTVYLIYYGQWSKEQRRILRSFIASLDVNTVGGLKAYPTVAGWWKINSEFYRNGDNQPVTSTIKLGGVLNDRGSMAPAGTSSSPFTHDHIRAIVNRAVNPNRRHHLPLDENAAYAVLTDESTHLNDFCTNLCAFHTSATFYGKRLAYTFVGNPTVQCPIYCTYRYFDPMYVPPNGDLGADAVCDKLGHELAEIATNPFHGEGDPGGWCVAGSNVENADLCEWNYGNVTFEKDMSVWNMRGLRNRKFLVQLNFNPVKRQCVLQWNS